jgi:reactive chlorine resistance protein C
MRKLSKTLRAAGEHLVCYSLALIILWFGLLKFMAYEAEGIYPLVLNSPLITWLYDLLSIQAASNVIGVIEIAAAVLIALRPLSRWAAAVGAAMAIGMFVTTLSFLATTPGIWEESEGGFPFPGPTAGFLLKDMVLLAGSVWLLGDALRQKQTAARRAPDIGGHTDDAQ